MLGLLTLANHWVSAGTSASNWNSGALRIRWVETGINAWPVVSGKGRAEEGGWAAMDFGKLEALRDQGLANRIQGLAHGVGFCLVIGAVPDVVGGDLFDQVRQGFNLGLGEVELERQHGASLLLIKYVINSKSLTHHRNCIYVQYDCYLYLEEL